MVKYVIIHTKGVTPMAGRPARRRRKINWIGIIFWLLIFIIIFCSILLIVNSKPSKNDKNDTPTEDVQQNETPDDTLGNPNGTTPEESLGILPDDSENDEVIGEMPEEEDEEEIVEDPEEEPEPEPEDTTPPPVAGVEDPDAYASEQELLVATVKSAIDVPYEFGGSGPYSFDTSGLVYYCFGEVGISVPRRVSEQAVHGTEVSRDDLQPGDVVFFYFEVEGEAEYVGIYVGNGKFIAARSTAGTVGEMDMNSSYYADRFVTARRYWD